MNENSSTPLIATVFLGLVTAGLLIQVSVNQTQTDKNLNEVSGRIKELESEVRQLKEKKQVKNIQLINIKKKLTLTQKERECLAKNIFMEANTEDYFGKLAIAQTTLNRVNHPTRWSSNLCSVVYQKAQFSWTLDKNKLSQKPGGNSLKNIHQVVSDFENGVRIKQLSSATFYYADYIKKPKWADESNKIMQVGQHIFYKDDLKV